MHAVLHARDTVSTSCMPISTLSQCSARKAEQQDTAQNSKIQRRTATCIMEPDEASLEFVMLQARILVRHVRHKNQKTAPGIRNFARQGVRGGRSLSLGLEISGQGGRYRHVQAIPAPSHSHARPIHVRWAGLPSYQGSGNRN